MQPPVVVNRTALRTALESWHVVTELGQSKLVDLEIVRDKLPGRAVSPETPAQLGLALRSELESALDEMQRTYQLASGSERSYQTLLRERYIVRRSVDAAADAIGVSKTEFYRRLNAAFDALASILNTRELRLRSAQPQSLNRPAHGTSLIFQVPLPTIDRLVGRDSMLRDLKMGLQHGRTTVLLGIPGVGKTSIAIALASDAEVQTRFPGGVLWANLGAKPDPPAILKQWGRELGLPADFVNTATEEDLARRIHERMGLHAMLVVIDDVWHLNAAMLLRVGGIHSHHLITTRLLDVAVMLSDIDGPARVEELSLDESITLLSRFVSEKALAGFGISLESLAAATGGLPLSLMLTGKLLAQAMHSGMSRRFRALLLALQDPSERLKLSVPVGPNDLGGGIGGQLSVYAQIAATEQVLSKEARRALPALGAFLPKPRTFSAEAATAVSDCAIEAMDELIAFGLLEVRPGDRFALHQSISEYARARLEGGDGGSDEMVWLRLSRWYADFAETNEANYIALDIEWDNLQHALATAQQKGHVPELLRALHAIAPFLQARNMSQRAYSLLSDTLPVCRQAGTPSVLAKHLILLARAALHSKALDPAAQAIREGLQLCAELRETSPLLPTACEIAALIAVAQGAPDEAMQWYGRALEAAQRSGQIALMPRMLVNMERLELQGPDLAKQLSPGTAQVPIPQPPIWQRAISKAHTWLRLQPKLLTSGAIRLWLKGVRLCVTGDTQGGVATLRQAAEAARGEGDPATLVTALGFYSNICVGTGDYTAAERCAAEGLPLKASAIFPRSVAFLFSAYALACLYRDAAAQATALLSEGLTWAKANGYMECESWLNGMASVVWLEQGDAYLAYQHAFDSIAQGQRSGVIDMMSYPTAMCGLALAHLRDYDKAWLYLKESVSDVSAFSDLWGKTFGWMCYGEGLFLAGNIGASGESFTQGLELAQQLGARLHTARAQFGLAKVSLAQGDPGAAFRYADLSQRTFNQMGDVRAKTVNWWIQEQLGDVALKHMNGVSGDDVTGDE